MPPAPVAKLVDALDLGSSNASCVGSSPIRRTDEYLVEFQQDTNFYTFNVIIVTASPILENHAKKDYFCKIKWDKKHWNVYFYKFIHLKNIFSVYLNNMVQLPFLIMIADKS